MSLILPHALDRGCKYWVFSNVTARLCAATAGGWAKRGTNVYEHKEMEGGIRWERGGVRGKGVRWGWRGPAMLEARGRVALMRGLTGH
jgi:hypothetical protein